MLRGRVGLHMGGMTHIECGSSFRAPSVVMSALRRLHPQHISNLHRGTPRSTFTSALDPEASPAPEPWTGSDLIPSTSCRNASLTAGTQELVPLVLTCPPTMQAGSARLQPHPTKLAGIPELPSRALRPPLRQPGANAQKAS
jgi:hypothetical protein